MKTFQRKKEELTKLQEKLSKSKITIFTSFAREGEKGLNVESMRELKKTLRQNQAEHLVGKKTIIDKALKQMPDSEKIDVFEFAGSMGIAFGYGDEAAVARSIYAFSRKNPVLKFFGALFGSKFINDKQFIEFAKLPSREVLISRVVGLIKYPLSGLIDVLRGNIRNLVGVLSQIAKNK